MAIYNTNRPEVIGNTSIWKKYFCDIFVVFCPVCDYMLMLLDSKIRLQ